MTFGVKAVADDVLDTTVASLLRSFQFALRALVPSADTIRLAWRDGESSPQWEKLAASVFDAYVRAPIDADLERPQGALPLAPYDIDVPDYVGLSWIGCRSGDEGDYAFVRLLSLAQPFDTVQAVSVGSDLHASRTRTTIPLAKLDFVLVRHTAAGGLESTSRIVAVE